MCAAGPQANRAGWSTARTAAGSGFSPSLFPRTGRQRTPTASQLNLPLSPGLPPPSPRRVSRAVLPRPQKTHVIEENHPSLKPTQHPNPTEVQAQDSEKGAPASLTLSLLALPLRPAWRCMGQSRPNSPLWSAQVQTWMDGAVRERGRVEGKRGGRVGHQREKRARAARVFLVSRALFIDRLPFFCSPNFSNDPFYPNQHRQHVFPWSVVPSISRAPRERACSAISQ